MNAAGLRATGGMGWLARDMVNDLAVVGMVALIIAIVVVAYMLAARNTGGD